MDFDGFPFVIGWELTLGCNLRCRHCASAAAGARPHELTLEECLRLCEQFPPMLVQEVDFTGGEPLLKWGWEKIAKRLHELGICTQIITNGILLGPEILSKIRDSGISGVGVSLDGLEATHDSIRGRQGLFKKVMAGIEETLKAGFRLSVITTINARNLPELPQVFELLCTAGVSYWQIQPMFQLGRARDSGDLALSIPDYLRLGDFVRRWEGRAKRAGMEMLPSDPYGYFTCFDSRQPPWRGCPAGRTSCGITSDGKIKGCLSLPQEFVEGDLRQQDFWDIWFGEDAFPYTRRFSEKGLGSNCQGCDLASLCRGGCTAMSYGCTGRPSNDPLCFYGISHSQPEQFAAAVAN